MAQENTQNPARRRLYRVRTGPNGERVIEEYWVEQRSVFLVVSLSLFLFFQKLNSLREFQTHFSFFRIKDLKHHTELNERHKRVE
jgi:ABC-type nickel/cobalt efflux system permease component RcnA